MTLREKLFDAAAPVTLFEVVPPAVGKPGAVEATLDEVRKVAPLADAINLPEIHDETREGTRTARFIERVEPRALGARIRRETQCEVVVNRCVVRDAEPVQWFRETHEKFGVEHAVLVGGESSRIRYPGPGVAEAARQVRSAGVPMTLGGISIPSRPHEAERIREKKRAGLDFFTTQVLFDSNDIVWLLQRLNGLEARIILSFAPVSHPRDLEFLRWLGADVPSHLDSFLLLGENAGAESRLVGEGSAGATCFNRSLDLAQRILMDVFDNLPPDPPPLGLNVEHINRRNLDSAVKMLERLGTLYTQLVAARAEGPAGELMRAPRT